jgi:hypothetical protein
MSEFVKQEKDLKAKLSGIRTSQYLKIADEVKNDLLLKDMVSVEKTRKKLNASRKKLTQKNTPANLRKLANIDIILSVINGKPVSINTLASTKSSKRSSKKNKSPAASAKQPSAKQTRVLRPRRGPAKAVEVKAPVAKAKSPIKLVDVRGDGNCFYRSLWGALTHHKEGNLTQLVYKAFTGSDADKPVDEDPFIDAVRSQTASKITKGIYDEINEAAKAHIRADPSYVTAEGRQHAINTQLDFFEDMRQSVFSKPDSRILYENWIEESSSEMQHAFTFKKFRAKYKKPTDKQKFYKDLAKIVADSGVYASESDVNVVKFVLEKADINLYYGSQKPKEFLVAKDGKKYIYLKKVGEHYNYWMMQ